jgi:hypothetical protein
VLSEFHFRCALASGGAACRCIGKVQKSVRPDVSKGERIREEFRSWFDTSPRTVSGMDPTLAGGGYTM